MLQLPDSMKQSQADLYLETYQVLDLEMSRLREIQRWQASASSKVHNHPNPPKSLMGLGILAISRLTYIEMNFNHFAVSCRHATFLSAREAH